MTTAVSASDPGATWERMDPAHIASRLKARAYGLGFDLAGIATLGPVESAAAFDDWVARGYAGEMHYLARGQVKRRDSRLPLSGAVSALVVALDYGGREPPGPIARYARGDDYHDVIEGRLRELHRGLEHDLGRSVHGRAYVDTGPLLERDLARRAGLGWFGKNTNLINPERGSFFFLGALLLALPLQADAPFEADRCGRCTRCLDACPTDAFAAPRVLDATRCISYLTIELRGEIPEDLREPMGDLIYGCDVCQDVCPWNQKFASALQEPAFAPRGGMLQPDPTELLALDESGFRLRFARSPVKRTKRGGLARNAAVALGNRHRPTDLPPLARALRDDADPLVRAHAAWALGRFRAEAGEARSALTSARREETAADVVAEIDRSLTVLGDT